MGRLPAGSHRRRRSRAGHLVGTGRDREVGSPAGCKRVVDGTPLRAALSRHILPCSARSGIPRRGTAQRTVH